jgi:3D-(3,5/4)-trihydroxycyclohexane-1,2-dione acylhydrolase (decyclizing)
LYYFNWPGRYQYDHRRGALATINRLPVLLLPGDIFATREPNPVLQQLESASTQDISVNDCFKPVSKYWDRINRPEQLIYSLPEVMRVLTSQAEMGAVTLSMPQDVQTHAYDFPESLFQKKYGISDVRDLTLQRSKKPLNGSKRLKIR